MYADMYLMAPDIWYRTPNKNSPPHREGIKSASSNFQLYRCWFALSTQQQSSASVFLHLFYKLRLRTVTTSQSSDCKSNAHETHRATRRGKDIGHDHSKAGPAAFLGHSKQPRNIRYDDDLLYPEQTFRAGSIMSSVSHAVNASRASTTCATSVSFIPWT